MCLILKAATSFCASVSSEQEFLTWMDINNENTDMIDGNDSVL